MSFPTELSNAVDGVTEIVAAHLNHLEAKVGTDNSTVVTSLDYLLKNAGSIDPGHKHTAGALSGGNDGEVFFKAAGVWGPGTPDAAGLVARSGDQGLAGIKTFTSIPVGPASNPTADNQLARKAYVDLMLPLAGGAMAGDIAMNNHKVTGLAAASGAGEGLRYDEWIAAQDPGHKHSKLWASDGSPEAVTVNAAGNVGILEGTPQAPLHVSGTAGAWGKMAVTGTDYNCHIFYGTNEDSLIRSGKSSGIVAIQDTGGNVGIGTASPGYKLTCNGEPGANGYTAWTNYSDIRFKQDISPLSSHILAKVLKLNPVTFSYNEKNPWGEKPGERTLHGFIAQELQELFPDMVGEVRGPDGEKYLTTNLSNLNLYLVQAIKEQQAQIEALQAKLN